MEQKVDTRVIVKLTRHNVEDTTDPRSLWRMQTETSDFFVEHHLIPNRIIKALEGRSRSFWFAEPILPVPSNSMPFKLIKQAPWQDW